MDRSWVSLHRLSDEFKAGLRNFIAIAVRLKARNGHILCPCKVCCNQYLHLPEAVFQHITIDGMECRYQSASWENHGEGLRAEVSNEPVGIDPAEVSRASISSAPMKMKRCRRSRTMQTQQQESVEEKDGGKTSSSSATMKMKRCRRSRTMQTQQQESVEEEGGGKASSLSATMKMKRFRKSRTMQTQQQESVEEEDGGKASSSSASMKMKRCRKSRTMQSQQQESVEEEDGGKASISSATMKMKRSRKSKAMHTQQESTEEDGARAFITDLPIQILMDILSRLSVKSIFRCRSVSKPWLHILLTPDFAKLHFSRAPTCPLLHNPNGKCKSTILYLVEIERDRLCYVCDDDNRRSSKLCANICDYHGTDGHVNMKLSTRFMLPNLEPTPDIKLKDYMFEVVNSCNGLLCLRAFLCSDPVAKKKDPIVIYNPVTCEYSVLPSPEDVEFTWQIIVGGLGFCPKTKQYKVLIVLCKWNPKSGTRDDVNSKEALIYTLGSRIWRRIGDAPLIFCGTEIPAFLNGVLHWFVGDSGVNNLIVCFDFEEEKFQIIPPPGHFCTSLEFNKLDRQSEHIDEAACKPYPPLAFRLSMGVLGGRLFILDASSCFHVDIWVMKDYGVQESWSKEFQINMYSDQNWPAGLYLPVDFLKNGDLLIYQAKNVLISYDGHNSRYFKIRGFRSKFEAIPHIPSFVSLKEVMGDHMEVFDVGSRLASSELHRGKTKPLLLVEKDRRLVFDSD